VIAAAPAAANPCAGCPAACCRRYLVPLCGYDVWLISTRQRLRPEQFAVVYPIDDERTEGFRLAADGSQFALSLDKQGQFRLNSACVFLVSLGGHDRCGIYADRPVVCHAYPFVSKGPALAFRARVLCPDGAWSEGSLLERRRRRDVNRAEMQYDIYGEVVARWNARVEAAGPGREFSMVEYYSYLLNVYEGLARIDEALGPDAVESVVMSWRSMPPAEEPEPAWLGYVDRARALVDSFYPDVPPLAERPMLAQTESRVGRV
jgi:Fe-S-cluster containining protein